MQKNLKDLKVGDKFTVTLTGVVRSPPKGPQGMTSVQFDGHDWNNSFWDEFNPLVTVPDVPLGQIGDKYTATERRDRVTVYTIEAVGPDGSWFVSYVGADGVLHSGVEYPLSQAIRKRVS